MTHNHKSPPKNRYRAGVFLLPGGGLPILHYKWRAHWLTLAILFTLMPLSAVFSPKGLSWLMLRDAPYAANTFLILAVVSWIQFFRSRRRLRSSGF